MKIIVAISLALLAVVSVPVAAQSCTPGLNREILANPTDCATYYVCAFGSPSLFRCPLQTPFFDACLQICVNEERNCKSCDGTDTPATEPPTETDPPTDGPTGDTDDPTGDTDEPTGSTDDSDSTTIPTPPIIIPTAPTENPQN